MKIVADRCNRCGRTVVKHSYSDSSDMVQTCDSFLFLCDVKRGEVGRPILQLKENAAGEEHMYCLDCLLATVSEWVAKMKKRGKSDIDPKHILLGKVEVSLLGKVEVSSPCPICGR